MESSAKKESKPQAEGKPAEVKRSTSQNPVSLKKENTGVEEIAGLKKRLEEIDAAIKQKTEFMNDIKTFFRGEEITMLVQ